MDPILTRSFTDLRAAGRAEAPKHRDRRASPRRRLTLVLDPRFPGGTSSAVASEIRALAPHVDLGVVGLETAMFRGRDINPRLQQALDEFGLSLVWDPPVVHGDVVVMHNPSCLKFNAGLKTRISCDHALVVTHENFLRPGGAEAFDVGHCLCLLEQALVCRDVRLAPVSDLNRASVERWLAGASIGWPLAAFDWPNICDMPFVPPTATPRDRRGRHSRPGLEKFPPLETMLHHFAGAEAVIILGADRLLMEPETPPHWALRRFGETDVSRFLTEIDFVVYFTHPLWRESFGRAIAEAIAAGKVVITDPETAATFGPAVIASDGSDVEAIVSRFIADPRAYRDFVRSAQAWLARFSPERVASRILASLDAIDRERHAAV